MKTQFTEHIKDKVILITGGTGSFGNTVIGKLLAMHPKRVIIFSRDEKKQDDMRNHYDTPTLRFIIGDVRDKESIEKVVEGVDYIFHAAALKQVPACEFFPLEAVKTNIIGTSNVIHAATTHNVKKMVVLSTDKAVYPINAMGMSKALMEKTMIASSKNIIGSKQQDIVLCGVRYGNVIYSRGSVLPYFVDLLKKNKPLNITHSAMTRFLLPLPDAVDLVLYALVYGKNGYMYVRKSPACTVETLAKAVCKLFDYKQGYIEVGIRAGEKVHETLVSQEEILRVENLDDYFAIPPESQGLDYNKYLLRGDKPEHDIPQGYTSENTKRLDVEETMEVLSKIPEIQEEIDNHKKRKN